MISEILAERFLLALDQLNTEIKMYNDEQLLWQSLPGITNPGGNLCLHLIGNLNHFIGRGLGNTSYQRNRDAEFASKNISRDDLLQMIDDTKGVVEETMANFNDEDLEKEYPFEKPSLKKDFISSAYLLSHMLTHFHYHLGQINYHRRIVEKW